MASTTVVSSFAFVLVLFISFLFFVNCEFCATPDLKEGECINVSDCRTILNFYENITSLDIKTIKLLHRSQCGYSGLTPKVCCQKSDKNVRQSQVTPARVPDGSSFGSRFSDDGNNKLQCGIQHTTNRIFDGTITEIDEFPWMALLIYQTENGPGLACGGVLISDKYVLTAAHCVTGPHVEKLGKLIAVRLGEYDLKSTIDCDDTVEIEEYCALPIIDVFLESTHPHPDYKPGTLDRHHDIALLRLSNTVNFTKFIQPICLPKTKHYDTITENELVICGWGKTEKAEGSPIKLKAKVPLVQHDECKNPYEAKGIRIAATSQLCAGDSKHDSCKGDSGGPLMLEDTNDPTETRWFVVGVISFGPNPCAKQGVPAIYTKILPYLEWIKSTMRP